MPTINSSKAGYITGQSSTNFVTARQNGSSVVSAPTTNQSTAIQYRATSGRGSLTHSMKRTFLYFDTTALIGTISSTSIQIAGVTNSSADVIVLKSTAFGGDGGTTLATSDFFSTIDYSTEYSNEYTSWGASISIPLIAAANTDIQNNNAFIVAIVEHDFDYANGASGFATSRINGIAFGTTITLTYTEASSTSITSVNGIALASIEEMNAIADSNIEKLNTLAY
tara:strand:- start:32 stop:706 length:675 start_codon:yes stop_codon:yes gene_type:complete